MLNKLPQLQEAIIYNGESPKDFVDYISSYIENNYCESLVIDISKLNIVDSSYITTLCSTKHYIKYPNGSIQWIISSEIIKDFNKDLELGNCSYILR